MYRRTPFLVYIAVFILTWPTDFAVRGIPKNRKELCMERDYTAACTYRADRKPCQVLKCGWFHHPHWLFHELILKDGVPDFTECGKSKICMSGECVDAHGPMPHYRSTVHYTRCKEEERGLHKPIPTRHQQCQNYGFNVVCEADDGHVSTECDALKCGYLTNWYYTWRSPEKLPIPVVPLTGTWCGDNKACYNSSCIPLTQWPSPLHLPTYECSEVFDICCPELEN